MCSCYRAALVCECPNLSSANPGEAFSNEDDAESKFDELDGGEYAAMLVDKADCLSHRVTVVFSTYSSLDCFAWRGKLR